MLKTIAAAFTDKNKKLSLKHKPNVYVEYTQGHWAIQIQNPGQTGWAYVLDTARKIPQYNIFGEKMGERPAVRAFESHDLAVAWVEQSIPDATFTKRSTKMAEAYEVGAQYSSAAVAQ